MITWLLSTRSGCLQAAVLLAFVFVCLFVACGLVLELAGCPLVDIDTTPSYLRDD